MKNYIYLFVPLLIFTSCSKTPKTIIYKPLNTHLKEIKFTDIPDINNENYSLVVELFKNNCRSRKSKKLYKSLCEDVKKTTDAKGFFLKNFQPYQIISKDAKQTGLLTGYYEASLYGSYEKTEKYRYPIYETPKDLINVDLSTIYPELKHYRLRGRVVGDKLIPYSTREDIKNGDINASIICYCDSKIDKFFLEVQGSGIVYFDDNSTLNIGYANQNGHKYRSIGKYLVKNNEIKLQDVSLESIKDWLYKNPDRVDEVLNYNTSAVFFQKKNKSATGALGIELVPMRSVAVDPKYIPLGSMLYLKSSVDDKNISSIVFAQDTGGAIKGALRADLFIGSGEKAMNIAGELKSDMKLYIILPKKTMDISYE
jgi:membrane-bound lytic murein transglycosylase A